jgi:copper chaperone CopZ
MKRRYFIQSLAGSGVGLTLLKPATAETTVTENANVSWVVKGFTCVTCAVGLQTILQRHKGIVRVSAAYPSDKVEIGFDSHVITPRAIKRLIEDAGFRVAERERPS